MGNYIAFGYSTGNSTGSYSSTEPENTQLERKYGWKRDKPDQRDYVKTFQLEQLSTPSSVDLRENCPPVYHQDKLGSCTANAGGFGYQFDCIKQKNSCQFMPSRLFIYYNERAVENTIDQDSGASIRDLMKTIGNVGVCREDQWIYDIEKFTEKPTEQCYEFAKDHRSIKYHRVNQDQSHIEACLSQGIPVIYGFNVYESFESSEVTKTGKVPMPEKNEKLLGGHAVAIVGYDREARPFIVKNSWGSQWGDNGYCYFPYDYIFDKDLCSDFWTIETVSLN